jgi:hypothetical protein
MGFWHTGYIEFHSPVGIDDAFSLLPPSFPCAHCSKTFDSQEELRKHRFESHPLFRPVMFVHGRELGIHPVRITQQLLPDDVCIKGCDRATLNGRDILPSNLPFALTVISLDVCLVVLSNADVDAEFNLDICVASEKDLVGVEKEFQRTARSRRLDTRAVEEFISAASVFKSAINYSNGICEYLYGILAKERASDSSLSFEAYIGKFSKAAETLAAYDRPLARIITSLVEFHFNHFHDSANLSPRSRVGKVANQYAAWVETRGRVTESLIAVDESINHLEALVTDWQTEQILRWGVRPLSNLSKYTDKIESFMNRDLTEFDRVKVHVLLGELHALSGNSDRAMVHARTLRNVASLETWAESLIREIGENRNDDET